MSSSLSSSEKDEDEFDKKQKDEEMTPKQHTATLTSEKDAEETEVLQMSSVFLPTEVVTQSQEMEHTEQKDKEAEEPSDETGKAEEHANEPEQAVEPRKELRKIEEPKREPAEAGKPRQELKEAKNTKDEPGEAEKVKENLRKNESGDVNKEEDQGEY